MEDVALDLEVVKATFYGFDVKLGEDFVGGDEFFFELVKDPLIEPCRVVAGWDLQGLVELGQVGLPFAFALDLEMSDFTEECLGVLAADFQIIFQIEGAELLLGDQELVPVLEVLGNLNRQLFAVKDKGGENRKTVEASLLLKTCAQACQLAQNTLVQLCGHRDLFVARFMNLLNEIK